MFTLKQKHCAKKPQDDDKSGQNLIIKILPLRVCIN